MLPYKCVTKPTQPTSIYSHETAKRDNALNESKSCEMRMAFLKNLLSCNSNVHNQITL